MITRSRRQQPLLLGLALGLTSGLALGLATWGAAAAPAADAKSLACEFNAGQSSTYEAGNFAIKPPAPINFLIVEIDLEAQTARVATGPSGTMGNLKIVRALNANHYIEVLNEGFISLTTVYDLESGDGAHPAVMSRHTGVLGQPVVTHHTGTCRAR